MINEKGSTTPSQERTIPVGAQPDDCGQNLLSMTIPINFLARLHAQLIEGSIRDTVGQIYFGEELSPENKTALFYEGINSDLIFIHNRGNES